jgi:hypothetical protein
MADHQFIDGENTTIDIPYNLVFSVVTHGIIPLPTLALCDSVARGRYRIMPDDIIAYQNAQAAAKEEPQEWDAEMLAPQHFEMGPDGYYEW